MVIFRSGKEVDVRSVPESGEIPGDVRSGAQLSCPPGCQGHPMCWSSDAGAEQQQGLLQIEQGRLPGPKLEIYQTINEVECKLRPPGTRRLGRLLHRPIDWTMIFRGAL